MHFINLDAYFYMVTQGDQEAIKVLYNLYLKRATKLLKMCLDSDANYAENTEDFSLLTDKLFFEMLNEYDPEKGAISSFLEYKINNKLFPQVISHLAVHVNRYIRFEEIFSDCDIVENISDPKQTSIQTDIVVKNFKYRIASKTRNKSNRERTRDKVLLLQYAGYTNTEICQVLGLSYSQLRTYIKNMQKDKAIVNLKLELK